MHYVFKESERERPSFHINFRKQTNEEKGNFLFTVEYQPINVEGMTRVRKS